MKASPKHSFFCGTSEDRTCDRCFQQYFLVTARPKLKKRLDAGLPAPLSRSLVERLLVSLVEHKDLCGPVIVHLYRSGLASEKAAKSAAKRGDAPTSSNGRDDTTDAPLAPEG